VSLLRALSYFDITLRDWANLSTPSNLLLQTCFVITASSLTHQNLVLTVLNNSILVESSFKLRRNNC
jgi:hypothetical protein